MNNPVPRVKAPSELHPVFSTSSQKLNRGKNYVSQNIGKNFWRSRGKTSAVQKRRNLEKKNESEIIKNNCTKNFAKILLNFEKNCG